MTTGNPLVHTILRREMKTRPVYFADCSCGTYLTGLSTRHRDGLALEHLAASAAVETPSIADDPPTIEWGWHGNGSQGPSGCGDARDSAESGVYDWRKSGWPDTHLVARQCGPWVRVEDGAQPDFARAASEVGAPRITDEHRHGHDLMLVCQQCGTSWTYSDDVPTQCPDCADHLGEPVGVPIGGNET